MTKFHNYNAEDVVDVKPAECCETCQEQLDAVQQELGAYANAVHSLFGTVASMRAMEIWLALGESVDAPLTDRYPNWRKITIQAADKLVAMMTKDVGSTRSEVDTDGQ